MSALGSDMFAQQLDTFAILFRKSYRALSCKIFKCKMKHLGPYCVEISGIAKNVN